MTLEAPPSLLRKVCKTFAIQNLLDCSKMQFQRKKYWKYILFWSAFLVDNVLGTKLWQLKWNMSYSNDKKWRIEFLPLNNGSKKCFEKSLQRSCMYQVKPLNVFYLYLLWSLFQVVTKCSNNYCFFKNVPFTDPYW